MVDKVYQNAFKEVNDILENTDQDLIEKIPSEFKEFIRNNMNKNYITNIDTKIKISEQKLLKETESILSLIYRTYWITEEEKKEFSEKDTKELLEEEKKKEEKYNGKNIDEIFEKRKITKENIENNSLTVVKKEGIIEKILKKIFKLIKK